MKKYFMLLCCFILTTGCFTKNKTKNIHTIIEEEKNILVGINYPITNYKKLDTIIEQDVANIYEEFKSQYETLNNLQEQSELNIDYTYEIVNNRYSNVTLYIYINSSILANPISYMKSYVFDQKQNKLLTIHDIITDDNFSKYIAILKTKLIQQYGECILLDQVKATITMNYSYPLFTFDHEALTTYFNPNEVTASYCDIIDIEIPLNSLELKIPITNETKTHTVIEFVANPRILDPSKKVIALTFDDGPSKYTEEILDILNENNAYATFFVIGNKVQIYSETLQKMVQFGNEIGNHSYNHKWLTKLNPTDLEEQITKTQDIIKQITGYTPTIIRPTYGSISQKLRKQLSLDVIMWTVDTSDWKYKSIDRIVKNATTNIKDLDIILMHDTHERTVSALKKIIPILKEQGFEFVTISELKEIKILREQAE